MLYTRQARKICNQSQIDLNWNVCILCEFSAVRT
jgi:hypothetical protein